MNTPDAQFRPIPLSIVDLVAIVLPGSLWAMLTMTMVGAVTSRGPVTPVQELLRLAGRAQNWTMIFFILVFASLCGYALKPVALQSAQALIRLPVLEPLVKTVADNHFRRYRHKMRSRGVRIRDLKFPFDVLHSDEDYYARLKLYFEARLGITINSASVYTLFMFVKRHLRLESPAMWEECERLEAEVRMSASLLLAATFSFVLAMGQMILYRREMASLSLWAGASFVAIALLTSGFIHTRDNEVSYAYANCLLQIAEDQARQVTTSSSAQN